MGNWFRVLPVRLLFRATERVSIPAGRAGNIVRGAFGAALRALVCVPECHRPETCPLQGRCPYVRIFEPQAPQGGPSGLVDLPRPFVFRVHHLEGMSVGPGAVFHIDLHLFDFREPCLRYFIDGCALMAQSGIGPLRGRAELVAVDSLDGNGQPPVRVWQDGTFTAGDALPLCLPLAPGQKPVRDVRVRFLTPTELKDGGVIAARPDFAVLIARIRDRLSALCTLYGSGELQLDFRGLACRAERVRTIRLEIKHVRVARRSSRTGQVHPLGGFIGDAEYEGDLAEFLPYLRVACWTGVGRQTVWGKGAIEVSLLDG